MAIAVGVVLMVLFVVWLGCSTKFVPGLLIPSALLALVAAILNLAVHTPGVLTAVGIITILEAAVALGVTLRLASEPSGPGSGLAIILGLASLLLFIGTLTLGILQLTIVV